MPETLVNSSPSKASSVWSTPAESLNKHLTDSKTGSSPSHVGGLAFSELAGRARSRTFLVVQWMRLRTSTASDTGLIPDWGSSTYPAVWGGKKNPELPG